MSAEKISNAHRSLLEELKGCIFSLTDNVDKKTVHDDLREKYPEPSKAN